MSRKRRGVNRGPDFIPILAEAFVELGYQRATTAELARRCDVRENELYRIWPNKKTMFLEAIGYVSTSTLAAWQTVISTAGGSSQTPAEQLIAHQARDHGHRRFYRLVFSGLTELDDADVRRELRTLYKQFHATLTQYVTSHRDRTDREHTLDEPQSAWALMGLAAIVDIQRELGLAPKAQRGDLLRTVAQAILNKM